MQGYRTLVVALVQFIAGLLAMGGIIVSEEDQQLLVGGILVACAVAMAVMRVMTKTPVGEKE